MLKKKVYLFKGGRGCPVTIKRKVGLIGTHPGVGVTHTGIMYANYLCGVYGYKTALLEVNTHSDLQLIDRSIDNERFEKRYFKRNKVTFLKSVKQSELTEIYNQDYECFICDYGNEWSSGKEEFLRCDTKIVVSSLTEWKQEKLWEFIELGKTMTGASEWNYLIVFGQKKDILWAQREWKVNFSAIDYNPDPFQLSDKIVKQFGTIY